jgi:hypothetical protein
MKTLSSSEALGLLSRVQKSSGITKTTFDREFARPAREKIKELINEGQSWLSEQNAGDSTYRVPSELTDEMHLFEVTFTDPKKKLAFVDEAFRIYIPDRGYWKTVKDKRMLQIIQGNAKRSFRESKKGVRKYLGRPGVVESTLKYAAVELYLDDDLEQTHMRAFQNGSVDMVTGELSPHSPDYYLTSCIAAKYVPDSDCPPAMREYVETSFGIENLDYVRAGISLIIDPTAPDKFVHLVGTSGSGKGVFGKLIMKMFAPDTIRIANNFNIFGHADEHHKYLQGCSWYWIDDLVGYVGDEIGAFYTAVERTPMAGRSLFAKDSYVKSFNVRYGVASTGPVPSKSSTTRGWARRVFPIPTLNRRPGDTDIEFRLQECLAEIISWALAMPKDLRNKILNNPGDYNDLAAKYFQETMLATNNTAAFIDACLTPDIPDPSDTRESQSTDSGELYDWYIAYCSATGSRNAAGFNYFVSQMAQTIPANYIDWGRAKPGDKEYLEGAKAKEQPNVKPRWVYVSAVRGCFSMVNGVWVCNKTNFAQGGILTFAHWARDFGALRPYKPENLAKLARSEEGARDDRDVLAISTFQKTDDLHLEKKDLTPNFSEAPDHPDHALHDDDRERF